MPVEPIALTEKWRKADITLVGDEAAAVFGPLARHAAETNVVYVHSEGGGDPVVLLGWQMWKRVAASILSAHGAPVPEVAD